MELSLALEQATVDELVSLSTEEHGEVVLRARVDPDGGGLLWEPTQVDESTKEELLIAHLRTKVWIAPMLRDVERNNKYQKAIEVAVHLLQERSGPINVLDIGSGTGLLGMLAARAGAASVLGCEMFPAMADVARRTTEANQAQHFPQCDFTIVSEHSTQLSIGRELKVPVDLLLSELLDTTLIGEGVIPSVRDAWQRLLKPDAIVIPANATVHAQLVQCHRLSHIDVASIRMNDTGLGKDGCSGIGESIPIRLQCIRGGQRCGQPCSNSDKMDEEDDLVCLSDPFEVFHFDFSSLNSIPSPSGRTRLSDIPILRSGVVSAVVYWWTLGLYPNEGNDLTYSTNPQTQSFQDHWHHAAYPMTPLRVQANDLAHLRCSHNDTKMWFDLVQSDITPDSRSEGSEVMGSTEARVKRPRMDIAPPACTCGFHRLYRRNQLRDWASLEIQEKYRRALAQVLKQRSETKKSVAALDVSDGCFLSLLATSQGVNHVISLETRVETELLWRGVLAERENLPIQSLLARPEQIQCPSDDDQGIRPSLLLFDGYHAALFANPLHTAMHFWYLRQALSGVVSSERVHCIPARARVKICLINSPQLTTAYGSIGSPCGFDHSWLDGVLGDVYGYSGDFIGNSFDLSMFNYTELPGTRETLLEIDFEELLVTPLHTSVSANQLNVPVSYEKETFLEPHAIVTWVDFLVQDEPETKISPTCCHVRLIQQNPAPTLPILPSALDEEVSPQESRRISLVFSLGSLGPSVFVQGFPKDGDNHKGAEEKSG